DRGRLGSGRRAALANQSIEHARLGIQIQSLTPELAASFKRPDTSGALLASVAPDSAGARARRQPGVIILSYNHQALRRLGGPVVEGGYDGGRRLRGCGDLAGR